MLRLSDIARKMFRRGATDRPKDPFRTRLGLDSLEDRVVPATVTAATIDDALEGFASGTIRLTRDGSTTNPLLVSFAISGAAVRGTDYDLTSSEIIGMNEEQTIFSVTIPSGLASVDLSVDTIDDGVAESDESVVITILSGSYTIGSPGAATSIIQDDDLPAVAFDGSATTSVNAPVDVPVLDLATHMSGNTLTVIDVTLGDYGSTFINWDGSITYTPDEDFVGEDSFTYTVEDEFGNQAIGTVTVTVTGPIAPPTSVWTAMNTPVTVEVLELAFDPDEDTLTTTAVTQGSHGTVVLNLDGTVTYTPTTSYTGDDSFTYTVEDPDGNEASHTITVTVGPIDPIALDSEATTNVNTAVNVAVLDLAYQPAGGSVTTTAVTQGAHGTVVIEVDGTVTYTPTTSYTGTDTFTYTVTDGSSNTATGTITVQVGPAASPVDDIINDLADIEDSIDNYDVNDPPDLVAAVSSVGSDINNYNNSVTSFISTNNIDLTGMTTVAMNVYFKVLDRMSRLQTQQAGLHAMLLASKVLVENLAQQLLTATTAVNKDAALIAKLLDQFQSAQQAHATATRAMGDTQNALALAWLEARAEWRALQQAYPGSVAVANLVYPTAPSLYPLSNYTPRP